MTTQNYYEGIQHVVFISTDVEQSCEHCTERVGGNRYFGESINHYIEQHGYKLLHVGSETTRDDAGTPWHTTVSVVGK